MIRNFGYFSWRNTLFIWTIKSLLGPNNNVLNNLYINFWLLKNNSKPMIISYSCETVQMLLSLTIIFTSDHHKYPIYENYNFYMLFRIILHRIIFKILGSTFHSDFRSLISCNWKTFKIRKPNQQLYLPCLWFAFSIHLKI